MIADLLYGGTEFSLPSKYDIVNNESYLHTNFSWVEYTGVLARLEIHIISNLLYVNNQTCFLFINRMNAY